MTEPIIKYRKLRLTYSPAEMAEVQPLVREIVDTWFKNAEPKPTLDAVEYGDDKNIQNWIILALFKKGYRIVKVK